MELTNTQKEAFDLMEQGKNILITGPGGTGKSSIIRMFQEKYQNKLRISITSTTGISSLLIGGTTLHSYLGIGLGQDSVSTMVKKIMKFPVYRERWRKLDTLVIDEISMLSPVLFDKLEEVARIVRRGGRLLGPKKADPPFGGIQLILSGDFCQLPVVKEQNFCFEANSWNTCIDRIVSLTEIIRQTDLVFQNVLNKVRFAEVDEEVEKILDSRIDVELKNDQGIKPTRILTTNASVDKINQKELDKLETEETEFYQYDIETTLYKFVKNKEDVISRYKRDCPAPETIQLCVGAQVMLLHNLDLENGLANGSRGVVVNFIEDRPIVKFLNGQERIIEYFDWEYEKDEQKYIKLTQIPLKLAWAITVHKSQGCTLDYAELDLKNIFEYGQAYVALSRVKTLDGLRINNLDYDKIRCHPKALEFYKNL